MTKKDDFRTEAANVARLVDSIDWQAMFGNPHGFCIPISVFVAEYLSSRGWPSRPIETELMVIDQWSTAGRRMQIESNDDGSFTGHMVAYAPTRSLLIDCALRTQESEVLKAVTNNDPPHLILATFDHRQHVASQGTIGGGDRGKFVYQPQLDRRGWRHRKWPFAEIRESARLLGKEAP